MSDEDDATTDAPTPEPAPTSPLAKGAAAPAPAAADPEPTEAPAEADPTPAEEAREAKEIDDEARRGKVELLAAVLLGLAGALTAFSAYKAALTDGDALAGYTESTKATSDANSSYDDYSQTYFADKQLFLQYNLLALEDPALANEMRQLYFGPELEEATAFWAELPEEETPPTPLDTDAYVLESYEDYEALSDEADAKFEEGAKADAAGDEFELANVYFAVSLFMAGVAALFRRHPVRYFALGLSVLGIIPGIISMINGQSAL